MVSNTYQINSMTGVYPRCAVFTVPFVCITKTASHNFYMCSPVLLMGLTARRSSPVFFTSVEFRSVSFVPCLYISSCACTSNSRFDLPCKEIGAEGCAVCEFWLFCNSSLPTTRNSFHNAITLMPVADQLAFINSACRITQSANRCFPQSDSERQGPKK